MLDDRLRALAAIAPEAGIFCDFDGTLSEIVEGHDQARAVRGAGPALAALARRFAIVAVISGRDLGALGRRLRAPGVRFLGLYGLEQRDGRRVRVLPEAEAQRDAVARAAVAVEPLAAAVPGVRLERKGLAVAVHFRPAADPDAAQRGLETDIRRIAAQEGLDVLVGRRVLEFRPRVPVDKGRAVRALIDEHPLRGALAIGDDAGDVAMFEAVGACEVSVRVAVRSAEMPARLDARADVRVDGPKQVVALLRSLGSA